MPPEDFRQQIHFRSIVRLEQFTPMCPKRNSIMKKEGVQKVFGTLDLFVSLLETEIKYPILQRGILPFWTPSLVLNAPLEALFLFL